MASASESGWETCHKGQLARSLWVQLRQRSYVLPWSLFLFAEGTDGEIQLTFHTHVLVIQGVGLSSLLSDLAEQRVEQLIEPDRTGKFQPGRGPHLTALSLTENK